MSTAWAVLPSSDVNISELSQIIGQTSSFIDSYVCVLNSSNKSYLKQVQKFCAAQNVHVLAFNSTLGKAEAIRLGFEFALKDASCDRLVQIDGHLKQAPRSVGKMLEHLDVVDACIFSRYKNSAFDTQHRKYLAGLMCSVMQKLTGNIFTDTVCGTRAFRRGYVEEFLSYSSSVGYGLEIEQLLLIARQNFQFSELAVHSAQQADSTAAHKLLDNFQVIVGKADYLPTPLRTEFNKLINAISTGQVVDFNAGLVNVELGRLYFLPIPRGEDGEFCYQVRPI